MIRTLIIDDEWHARLILRGLLEEHFPMIDIVGEAHNVCARVKFLERTRAGIVEARVAPAGWRLRAPNLDARVVPNDVLPLQTADLARAQTAVKGQR